jgi:hypothetical protein
MALFTGEAEDLLQPDDFLRCFRMEMRNQAVRADKDKIIAFEDYLKSASAADDWYRLLTAAQKINWPTFETAFRTRFPSVEKAAKTSAELQRELQEAKLDVNELVKTELVGGTEVYTHIAFTGKLLQLAQRHRSMLPTPQFGQPATTYPIS